MSGVAVVCSISAATAARSVMSQATTVTWVPNSCSSSTSSVTPGASGPRRLVRIRRSAPPLASQRATWLPSAPVPPVMSAVPRGVHVEPSVLSPRGSRTSRRTKVPEERTAAWSSPPSARTAHSRPAARSSSVAGRSTSPPQRWAHSRPTTRPSPQSAAWAALVSGSERPTETAPRVPSQSGTSISASPRACTSASVPAMPAATTGWVGCGSSSRARRESTPAGCPESWRTWASSCASAARSVAAASISSGRTVAPCAARASTVLRTRPSVLRAEGASPARRGMATIQLPVSALPDGCPAGPAVAGFQLMP
ncbi:hypothetical protein EES42_42685 [Streptomyces sp. ADI95-17]|nr:hypothetical protein EES42_42685 [Streptomyces sp. ADI95-17]